MVETSSDLGQNYYTANSWSIENTINGKHFCGHYFSDGSVIFSLLSSVISCLCKTSEYLGPHQTIRLETSFWSQMAQINILMFLKHFVRWKGNNMYEESILCISILKTAQQTEFLQQKRFMQLAIKNGCAHSICLYSCHSILCCKLLEAHFTVSGNKMTITNKILTNQRRPYK